MMHTLREVGSSADRRIVGDRFEHMTSLANGGGQLSLRLLSCILHTYIHPYNCNVVTGIRCAASPLSIRTRRAPRGSRWGPT